MPAEWEIRHWPPLGYHAFLSHSAEDRDDLVAPVCLALQRQGMIPWFDQLDYPSASDPYVALRENLLRCRHVVYFITGDFLSQGRGWCAVERSYAELIQRHFEYASSSLWRLELPLVFLPRTAKKLKRLSRSAWAPLLAKANWYDSRADRELTKVDWAVQQILILIQQQGLESAFLTDRLRRDQALSQYVGRLENLRERVTSMLPEAG